MTVIETVPGATARTRGGPSLPRYLALKAGGALVSLAMVVVLGFFMFRIMPGDPAINMTRGRQVSPGEVERLRQEMGLDQPLLVQFGRFVRDLFTGDLGTSYVYRRPVSELIGEYVGPTLLLTGTAALISVALGLWLGQKAAWRRGSWFDKIHTGVALVFWSVPTFWLGLLLLLVFGGGLRLVPDRRHEHGRRRPTPGSRTSSTSPTTWCCR